VLSLGLRHPALTSGPAGWAMRSRHGRAVRAFALIGACGCDHPRWLNISVSATDQCGVLARQTTPGTSAYDPALGDNSNFRCPDGLLQLMYAPYHPPHLSRSARSSAPCSPYRTVAPERCSSRCFGREGLNVVIPGLSRIHLAAAPELVWCSEFPTYLRLGCEGTLNKHTRNHSSSVLLNPKFACRVATIKRTSDQTLAEGWIREEAPYDNGSAGPHSR